MKKLLLNCVALLLLLGLTLPIFASSTPVADDGKWYYVKSQRYGSGGPWWTFNTSGTCVIPGALTKADNQKFTLVTVTSGHVTIKEYNGTKLTATNYTGVFDASGATTGWAIIPNTVSTVSGIAFSGENSGIHQGGSGWDWKLSNGYYNLADNCTFFFYEVKADVDLNIAIDDAKTKLSTTIVGTGIGQTTQAAHDAYQSAINTAATALGSTDATAIQTAIANLNSATNAFINASNPIVTSSTASSPVWYLIKNTTRGGVGGTLYTNGLDAQMKCTTAANTVKADGTSTGNAAPSLIYLFRFEIQAGGVYRIINAALPNGEALQAATGSYSGAVVKYGAPTMPSTTYNVNFIGNNTTLGVNEIKFVSTGNGTVWHDDESNNLVSWDGGTTTASVWYVEQYTGNVTSLYQSQYDALTTQYNAIADVNGNPIAPYVLGTQPGQYDATKFQAMKDAYTAMVAEKNASGITSQNMTQKFAALSTAISTFNASKVAPVVYGGTISTTTNYTLKLVQPGSANDGYYLKNPRVDANNGTDSNRPNAVFSQSVDPATCLWKFVASSTTGKYILCSTRRNGFNEYLDEEGRVRDASTYADNSYTTKTLMQNTSTFTQGTTLLIVKVDIYNNYYITGSNSGATLGRNATNWSTFKLEPYIPTNVVNANSIERRAYVVNKTIKVTDTTDFSVFTTTGLKVQNKELQSGVYFVKTASQTFKVIVE